MTAQRRVLRGMKVENSGVFLYLLPLFSLLKTPGLHDLKYVHTYFASAQYTIKLWWPRLKIVIRNERIVGSFIMRDSLLGSILQFMGR